MNHSGSKSYTFLIAVLAISMMSDASAQFSHQWSLAQTGTGSSQQTRVALDSSDNVVIAGTFSGTASFGGGSFTPASNRGIFLAKFDASGAHIWSQAFQTQTNDEVTDIAVDSLGNVIVVGNVRSSAILDFGGGILSSAGKDDIFVAKFDQTGSHMWSQSYGAAQDDVINRVTVDGANNVLLSGQFRSTGIDFGGGSLTNVGNEGTGDIFVAKLNASGTHVWSRSFGATGTEPGKGVAVDASGNVLLTGWISGFGSVDFGGGPLTSAGSTDIFLLKLDSNGNHLWSQIFGSFASERGGDVAIDASNNIFLVGGIPSTGVDLGGGILNNPAGGSSEDMFVAKFDSDGAHVWSKIFGGTRNDPATRVQITPNGDVLISGVFDSATIDFGGGSLINVSTLVGDEDAYLAMFSANGTHIASTAFGGLETDIANGISVDSTSAVVLAGQFEGSIDFGGGTLTGSGGDTAFVASFATSSTPQPLQDVYVRFAAPPSPELGTFASPRNTFQEAFDQVLSGGAVHIFTDGGNVTTNETGVFNKEVQIVLEGSGSARIGQE